MWVGTVAALSNPNCIDVGTLFVNSTSKGGLVLQKEVRVILLDSAMLSSEPYSWSTLWAHILLYGGCQVSPTMLWLLGK